MEAVHEGFHELDAVGFGGLVHLQALGLGHGERLLTQDMFSGLHRPDRPFAMQAVRQRNVDGLDAIVFEQGFITPVGNGNVSLLRKCLCSFRVAACDRDEFAV